MPGWLDACPRGYIDGRASHAHRKLPFPLSTDLPHPQPLPGNGAVMRQLLMGLGLADSARLTTAPTAGRYRRMSAYVGRWLLTGCG
jgi:hypothetical protein